MPILFVMKNPAHVAFAVVGLIWGSNFLFMKWAAETISAGQVTLLRVFLGFVPVALYAASRGALSRGHVRHLHHFVVMSVLATSLYYFCFASGASLLDSGIAGALSGAIPCSRSWARPCSCAASRSPRSGSSGSSSASAACC